MLEDILSQVNKPGRYIGQEWNISKKDFDRAYIKFALCFPDLYEIGMSNLGLRIIYGILNNIEDVACERFFSPAIDMENKLRAASKSISSLESKAALAKFDIIGFCLAYELSFTNVLNILDLGGLPLKASLRGNDAPLVIAGGPCALNPEPMHEFFDLFCIGEAEEAIIEIIDIYRKHKSEFKSGRLGKHELLSILSRIEGIYAPSLYNVDYTPQGKIEKFSPNTQGVPARINKRFVKDLDTSFFPLDWQVPYLQIVHDRIAIELMRGCPNKCRFCQARAQYFPFRQRREKNVLNLALETYKRTGYEEISLSGLSVSDYTGIEGLLGGLVGYFKEKAVSLSLPSIKPKTIVGNLSCLAATIRKTGLTFAPEAATERLRNILNKDFNMQDFLKVLGQAYSLGYQRIKLYFLIGLPYESQEDLDAILKFSETVSQLRKKVAPAVMRDGKAHRSAARINISVNTLIPKPHTPFQWFGMQDLETILKKQEYLKGNTTNKKLRFKFHNPNMTFLEGVFSLGDRRLSRVILSAFQKGARFDAWDDHLVFNRWIEAFKENNIDPNFYLGAKAKQDILPWDFIDVGISKECLLTELHKVVAIK